MNKLLGLLFALVLTTGAMAEPFVYQDAWVADPAAAQSGGSAALATLSGSRTFNPFVTGEQDVIFDTSFYTVPLITRNPETRQWIPYAAKSFEQSEDGLTIDVVIRDGIKWSDGAPVTADDWIFYYTAVTDEEVGSPRASDWFVGDDLIIMEKTGDLSLRFVFPKPDREAISTVATYPAPNHVLGEIYRNEGAEGLKAAWGTEIDISTTVWAGPFVPTNYAADERYVFERNPNFGEWNVTESGTALPYLERLDYVVAEQDAQLNLYVAGELDIYAPNNLDSVGVVAEAIDSGDIDAQVFENLYPQAGTTFYVINWNKGDDPFKDELFKNPLFRQAMSHLTPREAIVDLVYGGNASPAYSPVGPSFTYWYPENPKAYPFDPEKALDILAGLGFTEKDADGNLVDADGNLIRWTLTTNSGNKNREGEIQIIADTMREYGVLVDTQPLEFGLLVDQLLSEGETRDFDAILIGFGASTEDWPFFEGIFSCTGQFHMFNRTGDCIDPQERLVAELVRRGRSTIDDEAARQIGYQIMDNFAELQPIIYTTSTGLNASWLNSVGGELPEELFSPFNGTRDIVTTYRK